MAAEFQKLQGAAHMWIEALHYMMLRLSIGWGKSIAMPMSPVVFG